MLTASGGMAEQCLVSMGDGSMAFRDLVIDREMLLRELKEIAD